MEPQELPDCCGNCDYFSKVVPPGISMTFNAPDPNSPMGYCIEGPPDVRIFNSVQPAIATPGQPGGMKATPQVETIRPPVHMLYRCSKHRHINTTGRRHEQKGPG